MDDYTKDKLKNELYKLTPANDSAKPSNRNYNIQKRIYIINSFNKSSILGAVLVVTMVALIFFLAQ